MYSVLSNEIRMAPGLARTRESERGLFGYTERGFDDENEPRSHWSCGRGINGTSICVKRERHLGKSRRYASIEQ